MSTASLNHLRVNESGTRLLHNIRDTQRAAEKSLFVANFSATTFQRLVY